MQVIVKARHMTLSPALKLYAEDKLGHAVARVFDRPAAKIEIVLSMLGHVTDRANQECRATVSMSEGKTVVICEVDDDMYKAIDLAHHRLVLQVNRERGRRSNVSRRRKLAARTRLRIAARNFTVPSEAWEAEVGEFEAAGGDLQVYAAAGG